MTPEEAAQLLEKFRTGNISLEKALAALGKEPVTDLGFAQVDQHRALRQGFPEVIFGSGKTPVQVMKIAGEILKQSDRVLITRITGDHFNVLQKKFKKAIHHQVARCVVIEKKKNKLKGGTIAILSAGTSDQPVAEEAAITAETMGNKVQRLYDVGVAGLHRLLARAEDFREANVIIVVAGMEGALPSVVAGLVDKPVIAVPTSIGYGASFEGVAALLGMLNSCGSGVTVVNIDNGFGAAYAASQINTLVKD